MACFFAGVCPTHTQKIKNVCENLVSQTNESLSKIISESAVSVSNSIIQEQAATISSSSSGSNIFEGSNITVRKGGKFSISQQNQLKTTVQAILNITQSNELANSITSNIKNDVTAALSQNADLSSKVSAVAEIEKSRKNSGEINNLVNTLADTTKDILSPSSSDADIENTIVNKLNSKNVSQTDIENYLSTTINTSITQSSLNNCVQNSSLSNVIKLNNVVVEDLGSTFEVAQENILDAFYSCVISSSASSKTIQDISSGMMTSAKTDMSQGAKIANDLAASAKNLDSIVATSYMDYIIYIIIAVIGGVVLFMGLPFLFKLLKGKETKMTAPPAYSPPVASAPPVDKLVSSGNNLAPSMPSTSKYYF